MNKSKFRFIILFVFILLLSAYPLYMGFITLSSYIKNGYVHVDDYPKYIIPYAPLCISLIITIIIIPLFIRLFKKYAQLTASLLGTSLFLVIETGFEKIKVLEGYTTLPLDSWQYSLCIATLEVLQSIGEPIYAENNPAYKIHYYIIALIILISVINVAFRLYRGKKAVIEISSSAVFISLCILACFTAFWRNGTMYISPISSACMIAFFIAFGFTAGVFTGSFTKSRLIPAVAASFATIIMYRGELLLTGGGLFRFGEGFFFEPAAGPFAPVDILVIFFSGVITYGLMFFFKPKEGE